MIVSAPNFAGQLQPLGEVVDRDHPFGAHQECRLDREQPDRAAAPHRHGIARLDVAVLRRHPAGGQDVAEEQDLLVLDAVVGDHQRADIGKRHADVFRLSARIAAGQVAEAEQRRRGLAVGFAPDVLLVGGVAVLAA